MSNQHNETEFEKIMQEVEDLDSKGLLEEEIQTVSKTYGLHEDDDRDEILFFIAESNLHYDTV
tara:strand:+ start:213 stop:401 length:189 start_codon:yes stop_codon:yes gene_type:complete